MAATATSPFKDHPDPLQTRRIAVEWLRHLPPLDVVGRQEHVIRAFEGMRHACAAADHDRAAAIEHLDATLEVDHRRLVKWHLENLGGSTGLADRFWRLAHDVNRGFVFAYHALLESAQVNDRDRRWQQRLPLLITRLIHFRGIDARLRALRGERWIPARWAQLHHLFLLAADAGIERVPTAWDGADPLTPRWTVEQEYLHVLLAQRIDAGNLTPAELDWACRELRGWSRDLTLEPAPTGSDGFYVELSGTSGLLRRTGNDQGARVGYLDSAPLIRRLDAAIAALREADRDEATHAAHRQRMATLQRIRPDLAPRREADLRRHPRIPIDVDAALCVGLGRITDGLAPPPAIAGAPTAAAVGADGARDAGAPFRPGAPWAAAEPAPDRAGSAAPAADVEEIEIHAFAVEPAPDSGPAAPPAADGREVLHHPVLAYPGWRVKDRSLAGLRLVGRRRDAEALGVGTLLAVRTAEFDDWMLGVVRRVRKGDGGAVELGVSLLVERALPVTLHARRPASGDLAFDVDGVRATDTIGRFAGLYLIPPAPPEARPPLRTLIIPASEHFEGRSLFLATARSSYAVTLRQLVDRDADWCRVAIQVTARS